MDETEPRRANETTDEPYLNEPPILAVDDFGTPTRQINIDLEYKDIQAFWQIHLKGLWFVILICSLYFIYVFLTY